MVFGDDDHDFDFNFEIQDGGLVFSKSLRRCRFHRLGGTDHMPILKSKVPVDFSQKSTGVSFSQVSGVLITNLIYFFKSKIGKCIGCPLN